MCIRDRDGTIDTASCNQDVLNSGKVGDGLYALCNGINAPALLYNTTLLAENGTTVQDNMTMDEVIALSKEIEEDVYKRQPLSLI